MQANLEESRRGAGLAPSDAVRDGIVPAPMSSKNDIRPAAYVGNFLVLGLQEIAVNK